jgi:hypothetical protein
MSSRTTGTTGRRARVSVAVVVGSVVAALASPILLSTASALASADDVSVTIDSASRNTDQPAVTGAPATIQVDLQLAAGHASAPIYYTVLNANAPDYAQAPFPNGALCNAAPVGTTTTCSIPDVGDPPTATTTGTDQIEVFADDAGAPAKVTDAGTVVSAPTLVTFSGNPSTVSLTASSPAATQNTCTLYTLTASDNLGQRAAGQAFTLSANETPAGTIKFYQSDCTTLLGAPPYKTDSTGTYTFGVASDTVGSGTVTVTANNAIPNSTPAAFATASVNATWAAGGAAAVTTLTPTPTSFTGYAHTLASYTITATDHSGLPVEGVSLTSTTESGGPDFGTPLTCPSATDHNGQTTCTIRNNGTPGTDVFDTSVTGGTATVRPTATFVALPATSAGEFTLTCPDQTNGGAAATICVVPTDQHSVTYSATVLDTTAAHAPISGVTVNFATSGSGTGSTPPTTTPLTGSGITNASGVATFVVTNSTATNGDDVSVIATIGDPAHSGFTTTATHAHWETRQAATITITPQLQTITKGGSVTFTAQELDQFGAPWTTADTITPFVGGSDIALNGSAALAPKLTTNGAATFTYASSATATTPDTITATGTPSGATTPPSQEGQVVFVSGSTTAGSVTVDTSGNGTASTCPSVGTPLNNNLPLGTSDTRVCAIVKNSGNEALAGKTVTFTVSNGQIGASNPTATSTTTYTTSTNASGIATAVVTSTTSGTQTVTATADGVSGSGTLNYASPTIDKARTITASPTSATITAGNQQKFTWTVKDQYGNTVAGAALVYTQGGAGSSGATSSGSLVTGPDGTASVTITTLSTDNGAGSITATIQQPAPPSPLNQCNDAANVPASATTAGNCTASATYTVLGSSAPTSLELNVAGGVTKGHQETVTATVKNADGSPAANQVVRFLVTGANGLIGSSVTNAAGVATFAYLAAHAGVDVITAFDDVNRDGAQQGNEPGHQAKATITGVTDRPTIQLTSGGGSVTVHVSTHPAMANVLVTYYVKRYGAFRKIGTSRAGTLGHASETFFYPKGVVRRFKARVNSKQGITGAKTVSKQITVR